VAGTMLLRDLALLSECTNYLIKTVDPEMHKKMEQLQEKMIWEAAHVQSICSISPSLHTTLGIIVNRISSCHRDAADRKGVWAVMFVLGNFRGDEMVFSMESGKEVTIQFWSRDVILIKARDIWHEIKHWEGDLRVTLVYYLKEVVWTEYKD